MIAIYISLAIVIIILGLTFLFIAFLTFDERLIKKRKRQIRKDWENKRGMYVKYPKCCICGKAVPHEVIDDGDYGVIFCTDNDECSKEYFKLATELLCEDTPEYKH